MRDGNQVVSIHSADGRSSPWSIGEFGPVSYEVLDGQTILIIEQVYADPDSVRSYALMLPRWVKGRGHYPGQFLFTPVPTQFYCPQISNLLGINVFPHIRYRFAPFAIIKSSQDIIRIQSSTPHWDDFCEYVAIIYLNNDREATTDLDMGTSFWRHRDTGLTSPPKSWSASRIKDVFSSRNINDWIEIGFVQSRYNRMIVFPSNLFHRIEHRGLEISSSIRLTQNFYLVTQHCGN